MKNFMKAVATLFVCCLLCQTAEAKRIYQQDFTLTDTAEVTGLHTSERSLDSLILAEQLESNTADQVRRFYKTRDYQYAWITEEGLAEHTQTFWSLYDQYQYYSGDSMLNDLTLKEQMELLQGEESDMLPEKELAGLEFRFTSFFLKFFNRAYKGSVDPEKLQWHIPRKKLNVVDLLEELSDKDTTQLQNWLPVSTHYIALKKKVLHFKSLQQSEWPTLSLGTRKVLKPGDTARIIKDFKQRLAILGDLETMDTTSAYNEKFTSAVMSFQKRHGLNDDGIIGPAFMSAFNTPLEKKIEQMLINMERMRWMPEPKAGKRVVVNIPEFKLHVYQGAEDVLSMDVVVGKAANKTVIFSDRIKHVVFSPYWNLPQSIVRNEVLPGLKRDSTYLNRRQMEITGERNGLPVVRQNPGPDNALGRVKFIFPNKYLIYLHDTPAKQLFQRTTRAFSHGCIRLGDPFALAANLLVDRPEWASQKIKAAMSANTELWVNIKDPVPVYITYFTSWVDTSGKLNFRKDIYGHDERLASHLIKR
jgi:murein L,D-transpeptidase YcbB/YkuD